MKSYIQFYLTDAEKNKLHEAAQIINKIREHLPSLSVKTTDNKVEITQADLMNVTFTLYILEDSPLCESIEPDEDEPEYEIEPLNDIELDLT